MKFNLKRLNVMPAMKMVWLLLFMSTGVNAQIYFADNGLTEVGSGTSKKVQFGGNLLASTTLDLGASFTFGIKKGTTRYFDVLNNGNIGIGTNAPSAKFDVNGLSRFRGALTMNYGTTNRTVQLRDGGLFISRLSDGTYTNSIVADVSMTFTTATHYIFMNSGAETMRIASNGNVGVNQSNPQFKLDVNGTANVAGSLQASELVVKNPANPTFPLKFNAFTNYHQQITGGTGTEFISFGDGGNNISIGANELHFKNNVIVFPNNTQVKSYNPSGLKYFAQNLIQQGDTRVGYIYSANFTDAIASGVSNLTLLKLDPTIQTSVGVLNGNILTVDPIINTTAGSTTVRGFFYNPNISGNAGLTNIAFEATSGSVKLGSMAGTGTRMVVAGPDGVLSTQSISGGGGGGGLGFYTDDGTLNSNRIVNTANFSLTAQSITSGTNATVFQVINNVGSNAIRARDDGSVRLSSSVEVNPGGLSLDNDKSLSAFSPDYSKLGVFKVNNDGLSLRSNSDVYVESWNNEKVLVVKNSNNNVGVGTTNPSSKLHVVGSGKFEPTDTDGFTTIHAKGAVNWNKGLEYKVTDADGVSNAYGLKLTGYNVGGNKIVRLALEGASDGNFSGANWNFEQSVMFRDGISNDNHEDFAIRLKTNTLTPGNTAIKFYAENFGANPIMSIVQNGTVGIGTSDTKGFKFAVAGNMITEKLVVKLSSAWPDYVFEPSYKLPSLSYVEKYIQEHGHLPGVTNAKEVEEKGIDVADIQAQLLKKIEELTLYVIELKKEMDLLKKQVDSKK